MPHPGKGQSPIPGGPEHPAARVGLAHFPKVWMTRGSNLKPWVPPNTTTARMWPGQDSDGSCPGHLDWTPRAGVGGSSFGGSITQGSHISGPVLLWTPSLYCSPHARPINQEPRCWAGNGDFTRKDSRPRRWRTRVFPQLELGLLLYSEGRG